MDADMMDASSLVSIGVHPCLSVARILPEFLSTRLALDGNRR
jgi:hypothetical protein